MEYDKLAIAAKEKKIKIGFMTKGLYRLIAPNILEDEIIHEIGEGLDKKSANKCPVIVTDKNVYIFSFVNAFGGLNQRVIPLNKITSITTGGAMLLTKLFINDGTEEYVVDSLGLKANDIVKCINRLKSQETISKEVPVQPNLNMTDLRELKTLLDDGIITQEEFDIKKKQILGI